MGDLSAHFSRREFDSHDGAKAAPAPDLIVKLERLRAIKNGRPMRIVSGYRSPAQNRAVGGAPHSQHLINNAADLEQGYCTVAEAEQAGFTGIGNSGPWAVHVDIRPHRARWSY